MRFEYERARTGETAVRIEGRYLHSRYDPRREARRFVDSLSLDYPGGTTILIGDGTGIVRALLQTRFPAMHIITVEPVPPDGTVLSTYLPPGDDRIPVSPERFGPLATALLSLLHPLQFSTIQTITWPGATTAAPVWTAEAEGRVLRTLQNLQSELATIATFGIPWLSNALRRTLQTDERVIVNFTGQGMIIAAAGPRLAALAQHMPCRERATAPIIAASSALPWLQANGFRPALAVHMDGGFWARRYSDDLQDTTAGIAISLRAAAGRIPPPVLLSTGWIGEALAQDSLDWPRLREQPTVGATLIEIAHLLAPRGNHLVCGLDLCTLDLETHASPHRNDQLIRLGSDRLSPAETIRARRAGFGTTARRVTSQGTIPALQSPTLEAYRHPIATALQRCGRSGGYALLDPSPIWTGPDNDLPSGTIPAGTVPDSPAPAGSFSRTIVRRPDAGTRRKHAVELLQRWREEILATVHAPGTAGSRSRDHLDLLLHLAPVESVQWFRDARRDQPLLTRLESALERLLTIAERAG